MSHQAESLPPHPVAPRPQARDVIPTQRTVLRDRVVLNLFRSLEGFHAAGPLAEEGFRCVDLDGRLAGRRGW